MNRNIVSQGYETDMVIDEAGLERVRQITRQYPAALLWTHKTYIDGFATHAVFFENDFPVPHTLGGVNMAFAGLRFVARRAGAVDVGPVGALQVLEQDALASGRSGSAAATGWRRPPEGRCPRPGQSLPVTR